MLSCSDGPEQRRRAGSILNKREARNALARAIVSGLILLTTAVTL